MSHVIYNNTLKKSNSTLCMMIKRQPYDVRPGDAEPDTETCITRLH